MELGAYGLETEDVVVGEIGHKEDPPTIAAKEAFSDTIRSSNGRHLSSFRKENTATV